MTGEFFIFDSGKGKRSISYEQFFNGLNKEAGKEKNANLWKLFNIFDKNGNGTIDTEIKEGETESEASALFGFIRKSAGEDNMLEEAEMSASLDKLQKENPDAELTETQSIVVDFLSEVASYEELAMPDGGKEVVTRYADGTTLTIAYYPDGEMKYKKTEKIVEKTYYEMSKKTPNGEQTLRTDDPRAEEIYQRYLESQEVKPPYYKSASNPDFAAALFMLQDQEIKVTKTTVPEPSVEYELSERAQKDIDVKKFLTNYLADTNEGISNYIDMMGIGSQLGSAINTVGEHLWTDIKRLFGSYDEYNDFLSNLYHFSPEMAQEYINRLDIYRSIITNPLALPWVINNGKEELSRINVDGSYERSQDARAELSEMDKSPEMYFKEYENYMELLSGYKYNAPLAEEFCNLAQKYQFGTALTARLAKLEEAKSQLLKLNTDIHNAKIHGSSPTEGQVYRSQAEVSEQQFQTAMKEIFTDVFGDEKVAELFLFLYSEEGEKNSVEQLQMYADILSGIHANTIKMLNMVLEGESLESIATKHKAIGEEIYGSDFSIAQDLPRDIENAMVTGGYCRMAVIIAISILITHTPIMSELSTAAETGVALNGGRAAEFIAGISKAYGPTVAANAIRYATSLGLWSVDVGTVMLDQITDGRDGVQWNEVGQNAWNSAKFIGVSTLFAGPLANAVSQRVAKLFPETGSNFFKASEAVAEGQTMTRTASGANLFSTNITWADVPRILAVKGSSLLTDIGVFTGLEILEGNDPLAALTGQAGNLAMLRVMSELIEFMLGAQNLASPTESASYKKAIEKSGVNDWQIKEISETIDGKPRVRYEVYNKDGQLLYNNFTNFNDVKLFALGNIATVFRAAKSCDILNIDREADLTANMILEAYQAKIKEAQGKENSAKLISELKDARNVLFGQIGIDYNKEILGISNQPLSEEVILKAYKARMDNSEGLKPEAIQEFADARNQLLARLGIDVNAKISEARQTLGIADDVELTEEVLKKAYLSKSKETHSDITHEDDAAMQNLNAARNFLKYFTVKVNGSAKASNTGASASVPNEPVETDITNTTPTTMSHDPVPDDKALVLYGQNNSNIKPEHKTQTTTGVTISDNVGPLTETSPVTAQNLNTALGVTEGNYKAIQLDNNSKTSKTINSYVENGEKFNTYMSKDGTHTITVYEGEDGIVTKVIILETDTEGITLVTHIVNESNQLGKMKSVIDGVVQELLDCLASEADGVNAANEIPDVKSQETDLNDAKYPEEVVIQGTAKPGEPSYNGKVSQFETGSIITIEGTNGQEKTIIKDANGTTLFEADGMNVTYNAYSDKSYDFLRAELVRTIEAGETPQRYAVMFELTERGYTIEFKDNEIFIKDNSPITPKQGNAHIDPLIQKARDMYATGDYDIEYRGDDDVSITCIVNKKTGNIEMDITEYKDNPLGIEITEYVFEGGIEASAKTTNMQGNVVNYTFNGDESLIPESSGNKSVDNLLQRARDMYATGDYEIQLSQNDYTKVTYLINKNTNKVELDITEYKDGSPLEVTEHSYDGETEIYTKTTAADGEVTEVAWNGEEGTITHEEQIAQTKPADGEFELRNSIADLDFVKRNRQIGDKEIDKIVSVITKDANGDIDLIKARFDKLDSEFFYDYIRQDNPDATFLLDNYDTVKEIDKNISDKFAWNKGWIMKSITKDNLQQVLEASRKVESGDRDAINYLNYVQYSAYERTIEYSDETIEISTATVVEVLGGWISSDAKRFDRELESLCSTELDKSEKKAYGRCLKGIIEQYPEILDVVENTFDMTYEEYVNYISTLPKKLVFRKFTPDSAMTIEGRTATRAYLYMRDHNLGIFADGIMEAEITDPLNPVLRNAVPENILEGGIDSHDLTEVAPFAQRLEQTPDVEDLTYQVINRNEVDAGQNLDENGYPSLSEIDKYTRVEDINQANLNLKGHSLVDNIRAQQQVSDYLDKLLEMIPDDLPEVDINVIKKYADYILPDGTVISRNFVGDDGELYWNSVTEKWETKDVDGKVLFWIRDISGKEHVLPAFSPSNVIKARKILAYLATIEPIPYKSIVEKQEEVLKKNAGVEPEPSVAPVHLQKMNGVSNPQAPILSENFSEESVTESSKEISSEAKPGIKQRKLSFAESELVDALKMKYSKVDIDHFLNLQKSNGEYRLNISEIEEIAKDVNERSTDIPAYVEAIDALLALETDDGEPLLNNINGIGYIVKACLLKTNAFIDLINIRNMDGTRRFNEVDYNFLANICIFDWVKDFAQLKDKYGNYLFSSFYIEQMSYLTKPQRDLIMTMIQNNYPLDFVESYAGLSQWVKFSIDCDKFTAVCNDENFRALIVNLFAPQYQLNSWDLNIISSLLNIEPSKLADFRAYLDNFDRSAVEAIAPRVKDFTREQLFYLQKYHFMNGTAEFTPESLAFQGDFTEFLTKTYLDAERLNKFFCVFPNTDRNIGELPQGWVSSTDNVSEVRVKVQDCIDRFIANPNIKEFKSELSNILGKRVKVKELGHGAFGTGYKISVKGCEDVVLKTFKAAAGCGEHGAGIEPQTGIYLNENSNKFVHMYFGRVALEGQEDGFLVTQFLGRRNKAIEGKENNQIRVDYYDNHSGNIRGNKFIDYGSVHVYDADGNLVKNDIVDPKVKPETVQISAFENFNPNDVSEATDKVGVSSERTSKGVSRQEKLNKALLDEEFPEAFDEELLDWADDHNLTVKEDVGAMARVLLFCDPVTGTVYRRISQDADNPALVYDDQRYIYDENGNEKGVLSYYRIGKPIYSFGKNKYAIQVADGLWYSNDANGNQRLLSVNPLTGQPQVTVQTQPVEEVPEATAVNPSAGGSLSESEAVPESAIVPENVPEWTTKEQLRQELLESGYADYPDYIDAILDAYDRYPLGVTIYLNSGRSFSLDELDYAYHYEMYPEASKFILSHQEADGTFKFTDYLGDYVEYYDKNPEKFQEMLNDDKLHLGTVTPANSESTLPYSIMLEIFDTYCENPQVVWDIVQAIGIKMINKSLNIDEIIIRSLFAVALEDPEVVTEFCKDKVLLQGIIDNYESSPLTMVNVLGIYASDPQYIQRVPENRTIAEWVKLYPSYKKNPELFNIIESQSVVVKRDEYGVVEQTEPKWDHKEVVRIMNKADVAPRAVKALISSERDDISVSVIESIATLMENDFDSWNSLVNAKDVDGNYEYSDYDIMEIADFMLTYHCTEAIDVFAAKHLKLGAYTSLTAKAFAKLCVERKEDILAQDDIDGANIALVCDLIEGNEVMEKLMTIKDNEGNSRFTQKEALYLSFIREPFVKDNIYRFIDLYKSNGEPRLKAYEIVEIMKELKSLSYFYAEDYLKCVENAIELAKLENEDGEPLVDANLIGKVAIKLNSNFDNFVSLIQIRDADGDALYPEAIYEQLASLLTRYPDEVMEYAFLKDKNGNPVMIPYGDLQIFVKYNSESGNLAKAFLKNGYSSEFVNDLVLAAGKHSLDKPEVQQKIIDVCDNKDFKAIIDAYVYNFRKISLYESDIQIIIALAGIDPSKLADFKTYMDNFDKSAVIALAPVTETFTDLQWFYLQKYHFLNGTEKFTAEALTSPEDFTTYLTRNYLTAQNLTTYLSVFPNTDRNVGSLPEGWLTNVAERDISNVLARIRSSIVKFKGTYCSDEGMRSLQDELSAILGKNVELELAGGGVYGKCYKVSVEGSEPMALKVFSSPAADNVHGAGAEPQAGLYANAHSNDFVHMYFGRVAMVGQDDAFIVTQFLDDNTVPIEGVTDDRVTVKCGDIHNANIINGKFIDFGHTQVYDDRGKPVETDIFSDATQRTGTKQNTTIPSENSADIAARLQKSLLTSPMSENFDVKELSSWASENHLIIKEASIDLARCLLFCDPETETVYRRIYQDVDDPRAVYADQRYIYDENGNKKGELSLYAVGVPVYSFGHGQFALLNPDDGLWYEDKGIRGRELMPVNPLTGEPQVAQNENETSNSVMVPAQQMLDDISSIEIQIENAATREDFIAVRGQISDMPADTPEQIAEKQRLQLTYQQQYNRYISGNREDVSSVDGSELVDSYEANEASVENKANYVAPKAEIVEIQEISQHNNSVAVSTALRTAVMDMIAQKDFIAQYFKKDAPDKLDKFIEYIVKGTNGDLDLIRSRIESIDVGFLIYHRIDFPNADFLLANYNIISENLPKTWNFPINCIYKIMNEDILNELINNYDKIKSDRRLADGFLSYLYINNLFKNIQYLSSTEDIDTHLALAMLSTNKYAGNRDFYNTELNKIFGNADDTKPDAGRACAVILQQHPDLIKITDNLERFSPDQAELDNVINLLIDIGCLPPTITINQVESGVPSYPTYIICDACRYMSDNNIGSFAGNSPVNITETAARTMTKTSGQYTATSYFDEYGKIIKSTVEDSKNAIELEIVFDVNGQFQDSRLYYSPRILAEQTSRLIENLNSLTSDNHVRGLVMKELNRISTEHTDYSETRDILEFAERFEDLLAKTTLITDFEAKRYIEGELAKLNAITDDVSNIELFTDAYNTLMGSYVHIADDYNKSGYVSRKNDENGLILRDYILKQLEKLITDGLSFSQKIYVQNGKENDLLLILRQVEQEFATIPEDYSRGDKTAEIIRLLNKHITELRDGIVSQGEPLSKYDDNKVSSLNLILEKIKPDNRDLFKFIFSFVDNDLNLDFQEDLSVSATIFYCKNNAGNAGAKILYENYLNDISSSIDETTKSLVTDIYNRFGIMLFLSKSYNSVEAIEGIRDLYSEIERASNGQAVYPPVIDLLSAKQGYYNETSAYGCGTAGGYCEPDTRSIAVNAGTHTEYDDMVKTSVHEGIHANDLTKQGLVPPSFDEIKDKKLYRDEFKKAGIPEWLIDYAYNNAKEFIAVAAEGDMSKYSDEFKEVLVSFGMPRWAFDIRLPKRN